MKKDITNNYKSKQLLKIEEYVKHKIEVDIIGGEGSYPMWAVIMYTLDYISKNPEKKQT